MPGISKRARRSASRRAAHYFPSRAPLAEGYGFVHAHRYSKLGLVRGRGLPGGGRGVEGSGAGWRQRREAVLGGCGGPGAGACALDRLLLGMRLVPQEPVYLHHRLRGQLAQNLQGSQVFHQLLCT